MSSKHPTNRVRRQGSSFLTRSLSQRGNLSKVSTRELNTANGDSPKRINSSRYSTLKQAAEKDYPVSYDEYKQSADNIKENQIIGARSFATPQKVVQFNSAARNVVGGFRASKEGFMTIRTTGGFFKQLRGEKRYISVENANIRILAETPREDQLGEEVDSLLDIPFVELRAIHYPKENSKEFRLVFNSHNESNNGNVTYLPHTLIFTASSTDIAIEWLKSILVGCINTVLFLNNVIKYLREHSPDDKTNVELFLRQSVDLSTIARGLLSKDTVSAQSALSDFLEREGKQEESAFWYDVSYTNHMRIENDEIDEEELSGLSLIQDEVATSISLGSIDFTEEFEPVPRTSFRLPGKLVQKQKGGSLRPPTRRSGSIRKSKSKSKRPSASSQKSSDSEGEQFVVRRAGTQSYRITSKMDQDI